MSNSLGAPQIYWQVVGSHRVAWDANDNPLYEGWAVRANADTSRSVWRIKKYIWVTGSGGNQVMSRELTANSSNLYNFAWDSRAGYSYG